MKTILLNALENSHRAVLEATKLLREGRLVAFPTETVYGLGASVFNDEAVRSIFLAKGRPSDNPLIIHVANIAEVQRVAVNIPALFYQLAEIFFPGPLTIILEKHPDVPLSVSAGLSTVAVRMSSHKVALELIESVGCPLVAPSANRSGRPSPTTAQHVSDDLEGRISAVLDGGACSIGIESTVVDILRTKSKNPVILRPGKISKEELEYKTGLIFEYSTNYDEKSPNSPGMKYRHYAPNAKVRLIFAENFDLVLNSDFEIAKTALNSKILVLVPENLMNNQNFTSNFSIRKLSEQTVYAEFRQADSENFDEIWVICDEKTKKKAGLMNRLVKASE